MTSLRPAFPTVSTALMHGLVSWLPSFGFPQGSTLAPCHTALLDIHPTADLASRSRLQPLRAESNQHHPSCELQAPAFGGPRTGLSHCHAMPDTTLRFVNIEGFEPSAIRDKSEALPTELDATHRHGRVLLLHGLLDHKIQPASCLSPAGYSTVLRDSAPISRQDQNPLNCAVAIESIYDDNTTLSRTD